MTQISFEIIHQDAYSLARRIETKINGKQINTPTKAISISRRSGEEAQSLTMRELRDFSTFTEIYVHLSQDMIDRCLEDDDLLKKFNREISRKLEVAIGKGLVPYLLLSVKDNRGNPLNSLPAKAELEFLGDTLWHPLNAIIVPPIFGGLKSEKEHDRIIQLLKYRIDSSKERPILALIPSLYRSITRTAIEKYWKFGVRMFGIDLDGRTLGAQSATITIVQLTLNRLKKESMEDFLVGGFNIKESVGAGEMSRAHGLLSSAYGIDFFGGNHIRRAGWAGDKAPKRSEIMHSIKFFQSSDYGYYNLKDLIQLKKQKKKIETDTPPFKGISIESVRYYTERKARSLSKIHNTVKNLIEVRKFGDLIQKDFLINYFEQKDRIQRDLSGISKVTKSTKTQKEL